MSWSWLFPWGRMPVLFLILKIRKYLHPHVHCNITCSSQNMETTQVSTDRWIDKMSGLWTQQGRRGWAERREQHGNIYSTICKTHSQWKFAVWLRELKPVLCDNLEGWDGRSKREGTYVYLWVTHVDVWQKPYNILNQLSLTKTN